MTWGVEQPPQDQDSFISPVASRPEPLSPPIPLLGLAAAASLLAWAVLAFSSQTLHLVGWALGSVVTIGFVTAYTAVDAKRSQSTLYASLPLADRVRTAVALAGVVAAAVHAYYFATKVAS